MFTMAGATEVRHVAFWSGSEWQPLGNGLDDGVFSLAVYRGLLIAGGKFALAEDQKTGGVAKWDGNRWTSLGSGVSGSISSASSDFPAVFALENYNGTLIVGGRFALAGGCPCEWHRLMGRFIVGAAGTWRQRQ